MNTENFLSPFTNRPIKKNMKSDPPVFWCKVCQKELRSVISAVQHMGGKSHKHKISVKEEINHAASGSQKQEANKTQNISNKNNKVQKTVVQEPVTKKSKIEAGEKYRCDDCDIEFATLTIALIHYKGKKHVKKITAKATAKLNQGNTRGMARGKARGRGNSNRGERGVYNRYTFMQRDSVNYGNVDSGHKQDGKDNYSYQFDKDKGLASSNGYSSNYGNNIDYGNNSNYGNNIDYGNNSNYGKRNNYGNSYESNLGMSSNEKLISISNEVRELKRRLSNY